MVKPTGISPWRRRLGDVKHAIVTARENYFDPELFRRNANHAIQTLRTVTFIIQSNKASIPRFDEWYEKEVQTRLKADPVMRWLKDARNAIEKQGDLDYLSDCSCEVVFSYSEKGPRFSARDEKLLFAKMPQLARFARGRFPDGVFQDSLLAIERRWVATSFPDRELLEALSYGHDTLLEVVSALDVLVGYDRQGTRDQPLSRDLWDATATRFYIKLRNGDVVRLAKSALLKPDAQLLKEWGADPARDLLRRAFEPLGDLTVSFDRFVEVAQEMFRRFGYHISLSVEFGPDGNPRRMVPLSLEDHSEKFIYWRELGRAAERDPSLSGVIHIGEMWIRSWAPGQSLAAGQMPINGELLHIAAFRKDGTVLSKSFRILRSADKMPRLQPDLDVPTFEGIPNYFVPLARAWSLSITPSGGGRPNADLDYGLPP